MRCSRETWLTAIFGLAIGLAAAPLSAQVFAPLAFVADEERTADERAAYWIGVRCVEVPPLLRAQLDLPEGQGVMLDHVVPDSPASQVGLQTFDVVFAIDGQQVSDWGSLAEAVSKSDGKELKIDYLRRGHKASLTVKPAPRPESIAPHREDQRTLREWVERLGQGPAPMRFRLFHPGMVLPPSASLAPALPEDVTVTVEKQGGKPSKVTVKRGDKEWQATEESLDKLPAEVRGFAQQMLGPGAFIPADIDMDWSAPHAPGMPPRSRLLERRDTEEPLKQRLDEMSRQLDDLRKAVEKLQQ